MQALRIYAGPAARLHIEQHGLRPQDVGVIPGAAGGPKGLILGPLDRFIFGDWLAKSDHPIHLVGASIGAWRMATACLRNSLNELKKLEHDYIRQNYEIKPGEKFPSADTVTRDFSQILANFYAGKAGDVLSHPRFKLHIITSRGRHILQRERRFTTPLGYLGAFLSNSVARKAMGAWLERVVFSTPGAALPFDARDYRTSQFDLTEANFNSALQASCSIPFVLRAVHNISGAPAGAYWDGGLTDYHLHLNYATNSGAACARNMGARGQNDHNFRVNDAAQHGLNGARGSAASLVLYPHFQKSVVPGWLDKSFKWRHKATPFLDNMVLLAPNPDWIKTLPNGKLPDRTDFTRYGTDLQARVKAWTTAASCSEQLADEYQQWLAKPDLSRVEQL